MSQSSIEWYAKETAKITLAALRGGMTTTEYRVLQDAALRKAKEMHKKEVEDVELRAKEIIIIKHTEHLTPIELPTDEEIFQKSIEIMEEWYGSGCKTEIDAHFRGAKWIKSKIQGGNNGY